MMFDPWYIMGGTAAYAGVGVLLSVVAFIASIVVAVILYRKYISTRPASSAPGIKRDWGPFFRFESLIIENILKALYIFVAVLIAFECAADILVSFFSLINNPGGALAGIVVTIIVCIVFEVLNRLGFELTMMTILIWKNTAVIRQSLTGETNFSSPQVVSSQPTQPNVSNNTSAADAFFGLSPS